MDTKCILNKVQELEKKYKDEKYEVPLELCMKFNSIKHLGFLIITPDSVK